MLKCQHKGFYVEKNIAGEERVISCLELERSSQDHSAWHSTGKVIEGLLSKESNKNEVPSIHSPDYPKLYFCADKSSLYVPS